MNEMPRGYLTLQLRLLRPLAKLSCLGSRRGGWCQERGWRRGCTIPVHRLLLGPSPLLLVFVRLSPPGFRDRVCGRRRVRERSRFEWLVVRVA